MSFGQLKIHYPWEEIQLELFSEDPIQKKLQEILSISKEYLWWEDICSKCWLDKSVDCEICNGNYPEDEE